MTETRVDHLGRPGVLRDENGKEVTTMAEQSAEERLREVVREAVKKEVEKEQRGQ